MLKDFHVLQDNHTATWFLFISMTAAFCQLIDLLAVVFLGLVMVFFFVYSEGEENKLVTR